MNNQTELVLTEHGFEELINVLENPPAPNTKLVEAVECYKQTVVKNSTP